MCANGQPQMLEEESRLYLSDIPGEEFQVTMIKHVTKLVCCFHLSPLKQGSRGLEGHIYDCLLRDLVGPS